MATRCRPQYNTSKVTKNLLGKKDSIKTILNQTKTSTKTRLTLTTPYVSEWPDLPKDDEIFLCDAVKKTLQKLGVRKATRLCQFQKKNVEPGLNWKDWNAIKKDFGKKAWEASKKTRAHVVLGLSQVIRCLDQDKLCAVLLCRDVEPQLMIEPLLMLCASRDIYVAAVHGLGDTLKSALNFKSCRAFGLKRSVAGDKQNAFKELYKVIRVKALPLPEVMMGLRPPKTTALAEDDDSGESSSQELEESYTSIVETVASSTETLEPPTMVVLPPKDYSHLYISKASVAAVAASAHQVATPSGPAENFISLKNLGETPVDRKPGLLYISGKLNENYKAMQLKRLRPGKSQNKKLK